MSFCNQKSSGLTLRQKNGCYPKVCDTQCCPPQKHFKVEANECNKDFCNLNVLEKLKVKDLEVFGTITGGGSEEQACFDVLRVNILLPCPSGTSGTPEEVRGLRGTRDANDGVVCVSNFDIQGEALIGTIIGTVIDDNPRGRSLQSTKGNKNRSRSLSPFVDCKTKIKIKKIKDNLCVEDSINAQSLCVSEFPCDENSVSGCQVLEPGTLNATNIEVTNIDVIDINATNGIFEEIDVCCDAKVGGNFEVEGESTFQCFFSNCLNVDGNVNLSGLLQSPTGEPSGLTVGDLWIDTSVTGTSGFLKIKIA